MTKRLTRSLLLVLVPGAITGCATGPLRPFTTDGCSKFPDGTHEHKALWRSCCVEHDQAYWQGGSYAERQAADKTLRDCVAAVGEPAIAELMLLGVRAGGSPYWPTSFRWGYGWPWPRGYGALTSEEREQVNSALRATSSRPAEK